MPALNEIAQACVQTRRLNVNDSQGTYLCMIEYQGVNVLPVLCHIVLSVRIQQSS